MTELDFEFHKNKYAIYLDSPNLDTREGFFIKAQLSHANAIFQHVHDMAISSSKIRLSNDKANEYILYGFSRRACMLFYSYQLLWSALPASRTKPLDEEDRTLIDSSLNLIYINIKGCLDNLAWAYIYEKKPSMLERIKKNQIDLFHTKFKDVLSHDLYNRIITYKSWHHELKNKRDPVAHRMPIYVIPGILNIKSGELDTYNQLMKDHMEHASTLNFEAAKEARIKATNTGIFRPIFAHSPEYYQPIYPTVPSDLGKLIEIFNITKKELCTRID